MKPTDVVRPWGRFRQFTANEATTVKIIEVAPNQMFSLQYHEKRSEFWRVLSGTPRVTIGDATVSAKPGDEFLVPVKALHRIGAGVEPAVILEIAQGEFDEQDIVRVEDQYGRATT